MLFTDVVIEQAQEALGPSARRCVTAVVLAAGLSHRMGRENKLLLPISGEPLIRFVVRAALQARCQRVLVVLGHEAPGVRGALVDLPVECVFNEAFEEGIGSSVRVGANSPDSVQELAMALSDMTVRQARITGNDYTPGDADRACVVRTPIWKPFQESYLARGFSKPRVLVSLARKLCRVAFALMENQSEYQPA